LEAAEMLFRAVSLTVLVLGCLGMRFGSAVCLNQHEGVLPFVPTGVFGCHVLLCGLFAGVVL